MIGIRRVYKSVALIGCAHESVAVILRRALNSEAKYQVGSGSSGGRQDQKVEASDNEPNIAGDLTETRYKLFLFHRLGTSLEDFANRLCKDSKRYAFQFNMELQTAGKEESKFVHARNPNAPQQLKELRDAMAKLTPELPPAERKLGLGPCEVCGRLLAQKYLPAPTRISGS